MEEQNGVITMSFSEASVLVKQGEKIARLGWNGKGMFVLLVKGSVVQSAINSWYGENDPNNEVPVRDALYMYTAQGDLVPWVASHSDILADDWIVIA